MGVRALNACKLYAHNLHPQIRDTRRIDRREIASRSFGFAVLVGERARVIQANNTLFVITLLIDHVFEEWRFGSPTDRLSTEPAHGRLFRLKTFYGTRMLIYAGASKKRKKGDAQIERAFSDAPPSMAVSAGSCQYLN